MSKTSKKTASADEIADMASRGEDISAYFTNTFTAVRPVRRVDVDLTAGIPPVLDQPQLARTPAEKRTAGSRKRKGG